MKSEKVEQRWLGWSTEKKEYDFLEVLSLGIVLWNTEKLVERIGFGIRQNWAHTYWL